MTRFLRAVAYDTEEVTRYLRFDKLTEEDKKLISTLGFPGADQLLDEDPQTSDAAVRRFVETFLTAPDDE